MGDFLRRGFLFELAKGGERKKKNTYRLGGAEGRFFPTSTDVPCIIYPSNTKSYRKKGHDSLIAAGSTISFRLIN
jgi:hypothetical protein